MHATVKLDALTSLRFFAAAIVVIGHAHQLTGISWVSLPIPTGQGVSFFFVLSGFILAYNYPLLERRSEVQRFFVARIARVWPLHIVTCFLWIVLVWNMDRAIYFPGEKGLLRLAVNILLLQSWIPLKEWSLTFNGVSWSLSNEFFFYAVFPFLISMWIKHWHRLLTVMIVLIIATLIIAQQMHLPEEDSYPGVGLLGLVYFNPLIRLLEFIIGIAVAHLVRNLQLSHFSLKTSQWLLLEMTALAAVSLALVAAADFSGIRNTLGAAAAYYFTREGLWVFWAFLIAVLALSRGPLAKFLSLKPCVFLGEISFALYMVHSLVIHYLLTFSERWTTFFQEWGYLSYWSLCLLLSSALFVGVEQPMRKHMLAIWDKRFNQTTGNIPKANIKPAHSALWPTATALFGLSGLVVAMLLFRPSLVVPINDTEVSAFLRVSNMVNNQNQAVFNQKIRLLGIQQQSSTNGDVLLRVLLRAEDSVAASTILALHVNDNQGNILAKAGDAVLDKSGRTIEPLTQWVVQFRVKNDIIGKASSLGFVVYQDGNLFDVSAHQSDWNGKRLIIMLPDRSFDLSKNKVEAK